MKISDELFQRLSVAVSALDTVEERECFVAHFGSRDRVYRWVLFHRAMTRVLWDRVYRERLVSDDLDVVLRRVVERLPI